MVSETCNVCGPVVVQVVVQIQVVPDHAPLPLFFLPFFLSFSLYFSDREMCPGRCGMDDSSGIAKGMCNAMGMCECDVGYAGDSCEVECVNRCSSHGRCEKNMASNSKTSYHCFCESPWTGVACDKTAHSNVVVSSMVIVAIATFIVGLCCIPLMREYWQQREQSRYRDIIKGERDLRDQLEAMGINSSVAAPVQDKTLS